MASLFKSLAALNRSLAVNVAVKQPKRPLLNGTAVRSVNLILR
jgi:hypothetical protein